MFTSDLLLISWTKFLGKKPESLNHVISKWKCTSLGELSCRYAGLRVRLVEHQLGQMLEQARYVHGGLPQHAIGGVTMNDPYMGAASPAVRDFEDFLGT